MAGLLVRAILRPLLVVATIGIALGVGESYAQTPARTADQRSDAGRVALAILASFEKPEIGADAYRHEDTMRSFAARAASLPQSVQDKVWKDEFVPAFRQRFQNDPVGFALVGSPASKVIEVRSSRDASNAVVHDVFLQLDYASVERSSFVSQSGRLLRRTGLRMRLAEVAPGTLLWRDWALIPEMDEPWTGDGTLVACVVDGGVGGSGGDFGCFRSSNDSVRQAYLETAGTRINAAQAGASLIKGQVRQVVNPFRISIVSATGLEQTMQDNYVYERGSLIPSLRTTNLYVREPWFSQMWSGGSYSVFNESAKQKFLDTVTSLLGHTILYVAQFNRMVVRSPSEIAADSSATEKANVARTPTSSSVPSAPPPPNSASAPLYPISSGTNRKTRVDFSRNPLIFRDVNLYLNGSDEPIKMGATTVHKLELEVGSTHSLRAVIGRQTFEALLTVPNLSLVEVQLTSNGIVGRGVTPK